MIWKKEYRTGIKEIDHQHKKIINIINSYKRCISNKNINTYKKIGSVLIFLTNYTSYHFDAEESYLESINYPELDKQRAMHKSFILKLKDVLMKLKNKQSYTSIEFYYFLMDWLNNHILEEDMKIKNFVNMDNMQVELLPTEFLGYKNVEQVVLPSLKKFHLMHKNNLIDSNELNSKRIDFIIGYYDKFNIKTCNELIEILQSLEQLKQKDQITESEMKAVLETIVNRISITELLNSVDKRVEREEIKNKLIRLGVKV